jgi:hypothetical protein
VFDERAFKQTVVIPMGTICVPILTDLFLFSHEADGMSGFHLYISYTCVAGMLLHINGQFIMKKLKLSLLSQSFFLNDIYRV